MKSSLARIQRRLFLKQTLQGLAALGMSSPIHRALHGIAPEHFPMQAFASDTKPRRHLINLIGYGGWDSSWWHNCIRTSGWSNADPLVAMQTPDMMYRAFDPALLQGKTGVQFKVTQKYLDSEGISVSQNGRDHLLGKAFKGVFGTNQDVLVWKGMLQQGQHGIGNFALNQGQSSSYAKSFSAIVAGHLAANDYTRPLHYVSLSQTPADLFTNFVMLKGFEAPICIPDLATFQGITSRSAKLSSAEEQDYQNTLAQLNRLQNSVKLKSGAEVTSAFGSAIQSASAISNSNWGTSIELRLIEARYLLAIQKSVNQVTVPIHESQTKAPGKIAGLLDYSNGVTIFTSYSGMWANQFGAMNSLIDSLSAVIDTLLINFKTKTSAEIASARAAATSTLNAAATAINAAKGIYIGGGVAGKDGSFSQLGALTYQLAMADFLVRFDCAAVVDAKVPVGDEHWNWAMGLSSVNTSMAGFKALIGFLREVPVDGGGTLLDSTLIVMHTEMDRYPYLESDSPGTNHASTSSVLMAGYRANSGRIIGDICQGLSESSQWRLANGSLMFPYAESLPINMTTGAPDPNGTFTNVKSLLPTVCSMFGVLVPGQQVTEFVAVPAAIKS